MKLYDKVTEEEFNRQKFAFLDVDFSDNVLSITLDRPQKKNALHPQMIFELAYSFQFAHDNKDVWIITISANGPVFCAGADLKAMMGLVEEHDSTIPTTENEILIGELFNKVYKPVITKVTGDVYAGGFFFLAGASIVLAQESVNLGLPEVKRGLYPFQVMQALFNVMPQRKVIDWCIRGYNLGVDEALRYGLVTEVLSAEDIDDRCNVVIEELKSNSPTAIRKGLEALDHIRPSGSEHKYLLKMFTETIASNDGREGLKAFKEKRNPVWTGE